MRSNARFFLVVAAAAAVLFCSCGKDALDIALDELESVGTRYQEAVAATDDAKMRELNVEYDARLSALMALFEGRQATPDEQRRVVEAVRRVRATLGRTSP